MADDFEKLSDNEDFDEITDEDDDESLEEDDEGLPSIKIKMLQTGAPRSGFHEKNNPLSPYQRRGVMQRKGAFNIQCTLLDVIHGKMHPGSKDFATLVVMKFRFEKRRLHRRIMSADISLEFFGTNAESTRPTVHAIIPHDKYAIVETKYHQEKSKEGNANLNVGGSNLVNGGGGYTMRKVTSEDLTDATTVSGSADLVGYEWGDPNCASWTLLENEARKSGVPSSLQVAVLLKREGQEQFGCNVNVRTSADFKTRVENLFGTQPEDDPILFDPHIKPTNNLRSYETDKLGELKLESLWEVGLVGSKKEDVSKPCK